MEIESVPMPQVKPRPARKPRSKGPKVSDALRKAAQEYKREYFNAYGRRPVITYDGEWVRIDGGAGIKLRRLKELTTQLKRRG